MCLAVNDRGMDGITVITGSKDHYIKVGARRSPTPLLYPASDVICPSLLQVFEVSDVQSGIHTPKLNLEPPHYDGIQSLAIKGDHLFSGSRDTCIKKWDLANQFLVQVSIRNR